MATPETPATTAKDKTSTFNVLHAVHHDGKTINRGGTVTLTAKEAAPLLRSGFITKVTN